MTLQYQVEYTDTFGGEANYSWVRHAELIVEETKSGISSIALMRRAKALMGLSGVRGKITSYGDDIEFRPYRACTVMFINLRY